MLELERNLELNYQVPHFQKTRKWGSEERTKKIGLHVNYISTKLKREKKRLINPGCLSGQCSRTAQSKRTFWKDEVFYIGVPQ